MTNVVFKRNSGKLVSVNIKGHSGYDIEGKDIVCSAISVISITIANGITEILNVNADCTEKDGFLCINLTYLSNDDIEKCQTLMETMLLGMKSVEFSYGKYIKVFVEEV